MDIRNIQRTGGKSFVLTLPKDWITSNFMKDKDKVKVFNHNRYLNIIPFAYKKSEKYITCTIDGLTKNQIYREIVGYYLSGVENILVKAENISFEQRTAVRQISYRLIGCECLESTTNQMMLKNISSDFSHLMPEYVRKMISIIISMYQDTLSYLETGDKALSQDVIDRDIEPDRLHLAIIRSNNIRLNDIEMEDDNNLTLFDSHFYEIVAIRLERIGDHIVRIGKYFLLAEKSYKVRFSPSEKSVIKNTLKNLLGCQDMLYKIDKKLAHIYLDAFDNFVNLQATKKYSNHDYFNLVVAESMSRINSYIANISEEVINYSNIKAAIPQT
jgi:phosphate uptake regulator